ncbi:hypothetical protein LDENG_00037930 [Lucifuga dentata]|nr:hypothetical protein LDENG_00037930 [Lucifuga dentata]
MTNEEFRTLAYTKNPKTSKRTTFQDELQAVVSAKALKTKTNQYSYSDDFTDDDDDGGDFLKELLKLRKKKTDAFKAGKSKGKVNPSELSDDEEKTSKPKRVSFLKTQRVRSPLEDTLASESHENEPPEFSVSSNNHDSSFSSQSSTNVSEDNLQFKKNNVGSTSPQITREIPSKSPSYESSECTQLDTRLPLPPPDSAVMETPGPESTEEKNDSFHDERLQTPQLPSTNIKHTSSTDSVAERNPPTPKPRQRSVGLSQHSEEQGTEDPESQDTSRPQTSSASISVSTETASTITKVSPDGNAAGSCSPHMSEGDHTASCSLSRSSSQVRREQSQSFTKSTVDSGSRDGFISDDEGRHSTSFEGFHEASGESYNHSASQLTRGHEKSFDNRSSNSLTIRSQISQSVPSAKVESKYLGTLKVLDRKVSLQESPSQAADSLRAAIYQEWLKKKKETSREKMQLKKKEELLKEKKKKEEEAKKEDAVASYEAWKEKKKESLKAKAKEKQEMIRKEQRVTEEKEEKRQSAKKEFEKWKQHHDHLLREKCRKQRETESKHNLKKEKKEEERKRESKSAFSNWYEKKKNVLNEKVRVEREENKYKAEESCKKEDRDKMALEMYENWLARKDLEQERQREERRIQAILQDSSPPPWSPPNKTIPFRK